MTLNVHIVNTNVIVAEQINMFAIDNFLFEII